jgi:hypothetical protein
VQAPTESDLPIRTATSEVRPMRVIRYVAGGRRPPSIAHDLDPIDRSIPVTGRR